jgi:hypothetical protein
MCDGRCSMANPPATSFELRQGLPTLASGVRARVLGLWRTTVRRVCLLIGHQPTVIHFEQAVYGSFPFRDQGYAMLAQSPGCRERGLAEFRAACQRLGERPAAIAEAPALFALRLPSGPWIVVGVSPQGRDDRGRLGALAFHGLFLSRREYRKIGFDPFVLAAALRGDWDAETSSLTTGIWRLDPPGHGPAEPTETPTDPRAARIVAALVRGKRVALEAPGPIDGLARQAWSALPVRIRASSSVATWAFGNDNRFSLFAAPRLEGVALDSLYLDPLSFESGLDASEGGELSWRVPAAALRIRSPRMLVAWCASGLFAIAGVGLALWGGGKNELPDLAPPVVHPRAEPTPSLTRALWAAAPAFDPDPAGDHEDADPAERRRVAEALTAMADRFGVGTEAELDEEPNPAAVMEKLARELRYPGPLLSEAERIDLARDSGHDAALALRWDAQVHRFVGDRPLPAGFRAGRLRWQIAVLAWSFHCEDVEGLDRRAGGPSLPRRSSSEVVQALAEALVVDVPLRLNLLAVRYPALAGYLTFLGKLPRR